MVNLIGGGFFAAAFVLMGRLAQAQDFARGYEAYLARDYETAFMEQRPLAKLGNAQA